jgi:hypothetical protein
MDVDKESKHIFDGLSEHVQLSIIKLGLLVTLKMDQNEIEYNNLLEFLREGKDDG